MKKSNLNETNSVKEPKSMAELAARATGGVAARPQETLDTSNSRERRPQFRTKGD
ncbi:MAG: hypothetical protein WEB58_02845 [Planctomycetaceae bacterium]